jgi:hypothetical protein
VKKIVEYSELSRDRRPRSLLWLTPLRRQTAAKVRGFSLTAAGFTAETDCLLEGAGFELSVPGERGDGFEPSSVTSGPFLLGRRCSGPSCS